MRLLQLPECILNEFEATATPKFAILSNGRDNIHLRGGKLDIGSSNLHESLANTWITRAADHLTLLGIYHVWVAEVCISSADEERNDAVNGLQQRLEKAEVCFVYLHDLPVGASYDQDVWAKCTFWKQARALPDLAIPSRVEFFDYGWTPKGSRGSAELASLISAITNISTRVLLDSSTLTDFGLGVRISWAAGRTATLEEDLIYYLAPILGISIQTRYGEGREQAFLRLQRKVLRDCRDGSVFGWLSSDEKEVRGMFSKSPDEFSHFSGPHRKYQWEGPWPMSSKIRFCNRGLELQVQTYKLDPYIVVDIGCSEANVSQLKHRRVGILLRNWSGVYVRAKPAVQSVVFSTAPFQMIDVIQNLDTRTAAKIYSHFESKDTSTSLMSISPVEQHLATALAISTSPREVLEAGSMRGISPNEDTRSGNVTPTSVQLSPGVKRGRSGRPMSSPGSRQEQAGPSSRSYRRSHSDSESNSDSDSSSESEYDDYDEYEDEVIDLDPNHPLLAILSTLVDFVYREGKSWISSATYTTPPQDRLPPKKRCRTIDDQSLSALIKYEEGANDSLIARRFDGFYHLACPYYIAKPEKYYKSCLLGHSLQSIEDVIGHLIQHHKEPPYCPICRREFDSPWVRDQHVRTRTCTIQNSGKVDGVNERQRRKLRKRDQVRLGEEKRWTRVWHTVFPELALPESPYLYKGVDVAVAMMRDYWATRGPKLAEEYLGNATQLDSHDVQTMNAFYRLVLDDLLAKVWDDVDFRSGGEATGNSGNG
ncbi:unnamed protein product [Clonostachys byssicola]|uniref:Heterokaryon incompatibility domain-containing protein n=1 Tax=Clonostachys byssicola TaxID=160290 RepID=A0A9N9UA39_9HYPO|nr:unnamed protein product [Clonostachys byssicola]